MLLKKYSAWVCGRKTNRFRVLKNGRIRLYSSFFFVQIFFVFFYYFHKGNIR